MNLFRFDDFCIDQYSSYDDDNDGSSTGRLQNERPKSHGNIQVKSYQQLSSKEFIYKCTVCRETLGSGRELLRHVRTHTRHLGENKNYNDRVRLKFHSYFFNDSQICVLIFFSIEIYNM